MPNLEPPLEKSGYGPDMNNINNIVEVTLCNKQFITDDCFITVGCFFVVHNQH